MKITCFKKKQQLPENDVVTHLQPYRAIKRRFGKDQEDVELKLYYNPSDEFLRFELEKKSLGLKAYNKLHKEIEEIITSTLEYYEEIGKKKKQS